MRSPKRAVCPGIILALAAAAMIVPPFALRAGAQEDARGVSTLLRQKGCHACHTLSEPLLGPAYQAIAVMHGDAGPEMVETLAEKIRRGGAGSWGVVPMPRNDRVSEEEARAIAAWILEQIPE